MEYGRFTVPENHNYEPCILCGEEFIIGEKCDLLSIKPADEEERIKMNEGRPYNALAKPVHTKCKKVFDKFIGD